MSEEWKAQYNNASRLWFLGVDVQENPGGTPEARSRLCVLSGFLPHDLPWAGFLTLAPGKSGPLECLYGVDGFLRGRWW